MSTNFLITETRVVRDFERVVLKCQHENELIITQGDQEALTIQGAPDLVPRIGTQIRHGTLFITTGGGWRERLSDALTTSLNRPKLRYNLTVKRLSSLEVSAMASVSAAGLKARKLALSFRGTGRVRIDSIDADCLEVDLSGVGSIELTGHTWEQKVTVGGPGRYLASRLESHKAQVMLKGIGSATVWATRDLDVTIRGPGQVFYYGAPRLRQSIAPQASLAYMGSH